jgi:hypothetical protein
MEPQMYTDGTVIANPREGGGKQSPFAWGLLPPAFAGVRNDSGSVFIRGSNLALTGR